MTPAEENVQRWEYTSVTYRAGDGALRQCLNMIGGEGWEMCGTVPQWGLLSLRSVLFYFKRPVARIVKEGGQ